MQNGAEVRKQSGCYELKDKLQVLLIYLPIFKEMMHADPVVVLCPFFG